MTEEKKKSLFNFGKGKSKEITQPGDNFEYNFWLNNPILSKIFPHITKDIAFSNLDRKEYIAMTNTSEIITALEQMKRSSGQTLVSGDLINIFNAHLGFIATISLGKEGFARRWDKTQKAEAVQTYEEKFVPYSPKVLKDKFKRRS